MTGSRFTLAIAAAFAAMLAGAASAAAQGRDFYGVAPGGPVRAQDFQLMQDAGVGSIRILVDCSGRCPDLESFDRLIGDAAERGIRAMPVIARRPAPRTKPQRRALASYAAAMASRYGLGGEFWTGRAPAVSRPIFSWQILNEQNGPAHFGGRPSAQRYAQTLRPVSAAIRRINPGAEIVLGGMFFSPNGPGRMTSPQYLSRLYKVKRIKRSFNTVAIHPYAPKVKGTRWQIQRIRKVMRRNGHRRGGLRITEYGAGSATRPPHPLNRGPMGQARLLTQSFGLFKKNRKRWRIRGVHWFAWQDGAGGCPFCRSSGLLERDGSQKPAYFAYRRAAS